jgi:hypothetical protein
MYNQQPGILKSGRVTSLTAQNAVNTQTDGFSLSPASSSEADCPLPHTGQSSLRPELTTLPVPIWLAEARKAVKLKTRTA